MSLGSECIGALVFVAAIMQNGEVFELGLLMERVHSIFHLDELKIEITKEETAQFSQGTNSIPQRFLSLRSL